MKNSFKFSAALSILAGILCMFPGVGVAQNAASPTAAQSTAQTSSPTQQIAPDNNSTNTDQNSSAPKCASGPVKRTFGGTPWLVYGCDDGKSLAIVADHDNPASPFYFVFVPDQGHYRLHGEGTGNHDVIAPVFNDLKSLTKTDIDNLLAETKVVVKP